MSQGKSRKKEKIDNINATNNARNVRTENSPSVWLDEGIGGLIIHWLDRMRWAEATLKKAGE